MAAPGGKTGGRVSVRVIPDATKFRNDLKLLLKRVEQSMSANLMVGADTSAARSDLNRFVKEWNGKQVTMTAAADTLGASSVLRYVSRPRIVALTVRVTEASIAKAATIIASLSGARVAGDLVENFTKKLLNLDRALPKITAVSLAVANLTSVLFGALGGAGALTVSLGRIVGVAGVLPAYLGQTAVTITTLAVALNGVGAALGANAKGDAEKFAEAMAELAPSARTAVRAMIGLEDRLSAIRERVQQNFFTGFASSLTRLAAVTLPQLNRGLGAVGTSLGSFTNAFMDALRVSAGGGTLERFLNVVAESIQLLTPAIAPFVAAMTALGVVGSEYLPLLSSSLVESANQFDSFISDAAANGDLREWIDEGIEGVKALGAILANTGEIIGALFRPVSGSGTDVLTAFADTLQRIADTINLPSFQSTLATLFAGSEAGAAGLATALAPIGRMLEYLSPVLSEILSTSGEVVGQVLGDIADALSRPEFAKGLGSFFTGLQNGLLAIAPALPALSDALGTFLDFAGQLGEVLGPVLGETLEQLAPILVEILEALEPLLPILGEALVDAIAQLGPDLLTLVLAVLPLLPSLIDFLIAALPLVADIVSGLAGLAPVIEWVAGAFGWLLSFQTGLFSFFGALIDFFVDGNGSLEDLAGAIYSIPGPLGDMARAVGNFALGIINSVIDAINGIRGAVSDFANWVAEALNIDASISFGRIPHVRIPGLSPNSYASMATGGDVLATPGGVFAQLAEGGRAERVIDRGLGNKNLALSNALAQRALAGGGGGTNVQVINKSGVALEDLIELKIEENGFWRDVDIRGGRAR